MLFSEIPGQSDHKEFLKTLVKENRLPHALLLLGPEGCGHLALAVALSQYIQCSGNKEEEACGQCSDCLKAAKYIHPDIHFSFPFIGDQKTSSSKYLVEWRNALVESPFMNAFQWLNRLGAENKQGNINREECFRIIQKLSLKSFEGRQKILLMWMPEYLGKEGNRLLKLIEEPPENTAIILVAENEELILNTILSRCQMVKIKPYSDVEIQNELLARYQMGEEEAEQIAYLAEGNLNQALNIQDDYDEGNTEFVLSFFRLCYSAKAKDLTQWINEFAGIGRERQKVVLNGGIHFLSQLLRIKVNPESRIRLNKKEQSTAEKMAGLLDFTKIESLVELLNDSITNIQRNAHPKILMMDLAMQCNSVMRAEKLLNIN